MTNKYEQARGVAVFSWQQGAPCEHHHYGEVLLETWTPSLALGWSQNATPETYVIANVRAARWSRDAKNWVLLDGDAYSETRHGVIRRWARMPSRTARIAVTIDKWGAP